MSDSTDFRTFTFGLKLGKQRLHSVLKAGRTLNSTRDFSSVLNTILSVSVTELNAETGTVFLYDEETDQLVSKIVQDDEVNEIRVPFDKGLAGATFKEKKILNIKDPYNDDRFDPSSDKERGFKTRNLLSIPMLNRTGDAIGVIQVLNKKVGEFDDFDEEFSTILATFSAIAVENAKQLEYIIERERLEKELTLAESIQSTFLQGEVPEFDGYDIAAVSRPCYQIGGDYIRLDRVNKEEYLALIADVSGKGIPAALITLALHSAIKILLPCEQDHAEENIAVSSRTDYPILLNSLLRSVTNSRAFVTFCPVVINNQKDVLIFGNFGHTEPVIVRSNGDIERIAPKAPVLGILPEIVPEYEYVKFKSGDLVCLFTDGVDEASSGPSDDDGNREEFGVEKLIKILKKNSKKKSSEIIDSVLKEVDDFTKDHRIEDDVTLIVIKKK